MKVYARKPTCKVILTKVQRKLIKERKLSKKQRSNFPKLRPEFPGRI